MASSWWSRQPPPTSMATTSHLPPPWPQLKRSLNTFDGCVRSVVHCRRPRGSFFYLVHFTKNSHSNGRNAAFPRDAWHGYVPWYPSTIQWIIRTPARTVRPGRWESRRSPPNLLAAHVRRFHAFCADMNALQALMDDPQIRTSMVPRFALASSTRSPARLAHVASTSDKSDRRCYDGGVDPGPRVRPNGCCHAGADACRRPG